MTVDQMIWHHQSLSAAIKSGPQSFAASNAILSSQNDGRENYIFDNFRFERLHSGNGAVPGERHLQQRRRQTFRTILRQQQRGVGRNRENYLVSCSLCLMLASKVRAYPSGAPHLQG